MNYAPSLAFRGRKPQLKKGRQKLPALNGHGILLPFALACNAMAMVVTCIEPTPKSRSTPSPCLPKHISFVGQAVRLCLVFGESIYHSRASLDHLPFHHRYPIEVEHSKDDLVLSVRTCIFRDSAILLG